MTLGLSTALRTSHVTNINTAINAGGGAGLLRVYDGTRPATGGTATNLLVTLTFSNPAAPAPSGGVVTFSAIKSGTAARTGTATWCRIVDSTGAFVADGSVGTSGADYNLNTTSITAGVSVSCNTGATITAGNP